MRDEIERGGELEELVERLVANWIDGNISIVKKELEALKGKEAADVGLKVWSKLKKTEAMSFASWLGK